MKNLDRLLGGPAPAVLAKLALASLLVGFFMHVTGLTPSTLLENIRELASTAGLWIAYGAVVVVPLYLLSRLAKRPRAAAHPPREPRD